MSCFNFRAQNLKKDGLEHNLTLNLDGSVLFFREYAGELRIIALRRIKLVCYNAGQLGARTRSYNTSGLYGKKDNLNPYMDNH
jgi:hypothetical protein